VSRETPSLLRVPSQETPSADIFLKKLWEENPVFVHLLGMCPVLAVSNSVANALAMGLATTFVLCCSSLLVSTVRKAVPKQVRIATFIMIIASFVTVAEYLVQAVSLEIHKSLGAFLSLIVVNCIILGRAESFASKNRPLPSLVDALGTGVGFTVAILCMGAIREALGNGTILGIPVFGPNFEPWIVMILPSGGFFVLGALLLGVNWINKRGRGGAS
jgi:electron transport complex protein RnfE